MFEPNLYTLTSGDEEWGIHQFKGSETMVVQKHPCGDWFTVRPAKGTDLQYFAAFGTAVKAVKATAPVPAAEVPVCDSGE